MKKLIITGLVFSILLFASSAFAEGWGNYYVKATGPYEGPSAVLGKMSLVKLQPVAGGNSIYFRVLADRENEILAVALSALSLNAPVRVYIKKLYNNTHWSDFVVTSMFVGETVKDLS